MNLGEPVPIPGFPSEEELAGWTADGRSIYVYRGDQIPTRVYRVDVATGKRELWRELMPFDSAGVAMGGNVLPTPDGRAYAYEYSQGPGSTLYVARGLVSSRSFTTTASRRAARGRAADTRSVGPSSGCPAGSRCPARCPALRTSPGRPRRGSERPGLVDGGLGPAVRDVEEVGDQRRRQESADRQGVCQVQVELKDVRRSSRRASRRYEALVDAVEVVGAELGDWGAAQVLREESRHQAKRPAVGAVQLRLVRPIVRQRP